MFPGEATVSKMESVPEPTFVTVCPFIVNVPFLIPYRLVPPHEPSPVISTSLNMASKLLAVFVQMIAPAPPTPSPSKYSLRVAIPVLG